MVIRRVVIGSKRRGNNSRRVQFRLRNGIGVKFGGVLFSKFGARAAPRVRNVHMANPKQPWVTYRGHAIPFPMGTVSETTVDNGD